jgi:uncharacterized RDD family membrane protein YckC
MEVEIAPLVSRAYVAADHLFASILAFPGIIVAYMLRGSHPLAFPLLVAVSLGITNILYFIYFEGRDGTTPAKDWAGLQVVTKDGDAISARAALLRNLARLVDVSTFYLTGIGFALMNPYNQRVGDYIADTVVIDTRNNRKDSYQFIEQDMSLQVQAVGALLAILGLLPVFGFVIQLLLAL